MFDKMKAIIQYDSKAALERFIADEIQHQPDKKDFFEGLLKSSFFVSFFERGFIEGASWQLKHRNTTFVMESKETL